MNNTFVKKQYGSSYSLLDYVVKHQLDEIRPANVVDFGAGAGKNGALIREVLGNSCRIVAVEGFGETAKMLADKGVYDEVNNELLQAWHTNNTQHYDLAIYGDVLEHLTPNEIKLVMKHSLKYFDNIIIVAPLHDIFQDAVYGNPLEVHRSYITETFFDRYLPVEKHVAITEGYNVMNIRIFSGMQKISLKKRTLKKLFHLVMIVFQPLGIARPFVDFLKRYFIKYKYLVRS